MSGSCRRPAGPVRQHSLQQPPPRRAQQPIRRQRSSEDSLPQPANPRVRFAEQCQSSAPKLRLAWNEPSKCQPELVGRQIAASRTSSAHRPANRGPARSLAADKATVLYSRQELAERLRLAWRQREANRSNIDIFLAHGTAVEDERCDSSLSTVTSCLPTPKNPPKDGQTQTRDWQLEARRPSEAQVQAWLPDDEAELKRCDDEPEREADRRDGETSSDEEPVEEEELCEQSPFISINCREWKAPRGEEEPAAQPEPPPGPKEPDYSLARLKRASYQSGLNKAFQTPVVEKPATPRLSSRASSLAGAQQEPGRCRRTGSAPQRRSASLECAPAEPEGEQARTKSARPVKSAPPVKRRSRLTKRRSNKDETPESAGKSEPRSNADVVTMVSLVSSADSESEVDETSGRDDKLICELRSKLPTTPIIKSSNSLAPGFRRPFKSVSFQQDSFEADSPPATASRDDDSSRASLRARFAALSRSIPGSVDNAPLLAGCRRSETIFQRASPQPSKYPEALVKSDTLNPTASLVLTDREKRCLAVPIGDVHDKKRKLVRCRSAGIAAPRLAGDAEKQSTPADASQTSLRTDTRIDSRTPNPPGLRVNDTCKVMTSRIMPTAEGSPDKANDSPKEPYGQTAKEKECWHLYRKMCDKGVFVSFDTVLRGMLTPTEYRLRQKEVSQNC